MKKLILVLAILTIAAPAFAALDMSLTKLTGNNVKISYSGADPCNLPRAFALVIDVNGGKADVNDVYGYKIGESNSVNRGYGIYPATIAIEANGAVTAWGNPKASAGDPLPVGADQVLPSNKLVLEFGSLYAPVRDSANSPATSGDLCTLSIDCNGATGNVDINMTGESVYRGGAIVLEDGTVVPIQKTLAYACTIECYAGMADYAQWTEARKPNCWCYPRQCLGDADGLKQGNSKDGYWYVGAADLSILLNAWQIKNSPRGPGVTGNQGCADFDRLRQGNSKDGYWRVGAGDLSILLAKWQIKESPKGPGMSPTCLPNNMTP